MTILDYRDHRDIMADILQTLSERGGFVSDAGVHINTLIYGTGCQWTALTWTLEELAEKEMIIEKSKERRRTFFITPKGIKFLHLYRQLKEYLK